ncbi:outer membrane beta-barrel protein [uncultured Tenacibaculum sp.]|uniref:outer membrane beta-barrel protein n=1 Tax=uncultured Tenacibaculum sp. TaxID=174713 RepID=UPI00260345FF|nr:outer membrane beta-barrel protein [uncultured Tenacibaculum sp.]
MKKNLTTLVILFIVLNSFSQTRFGINSKINFNDSSNIWQLGGGSIGFITETKLSDKWSLNADISFIPFYDYSIKKPGIKDTFGNDVNAIGFSSSVLNIPLKINYALNKTFTLESGLDINYRTSIKHNITDLNSISLINKIKKTDFGFLIGIGINTSERFAIKIGRTFGLSNIVDNTKNSYFTLSFNYFFSKLD